MLGGSESKKMIDVPVGASVAAPKVLVVGTDLDRCETYILRGVAQAGFQVHVMASPTTPYAAKLHEVGITTSGITFWGRLDLKAIKAIRAEVIRGGYQISHFLSARAVSNGLIATLGLPIKNVAYRGTIGHVSRIDPSSWLSFLHPKLDKIVCVSDAVRGYLETRVPSRKLVTIHKGHSPSWYRRAEVRDLSCYGVPKEAFVISCVANMRPVKGVPYLLAAMDALPQELNAHLLLIGKIDASAQKALSEERKFPERIHAIGFQESASTIVSQTDCFVLPSIEREGLPKALLEAMSVGVAPIATRVGGMPEVVEDGVNGLVVAPADSAALVAAIVKMASDGGARAKYAAAAFETIRTKFTVERSVEKTLNLYRELL